MTSAAFYCMSSELFFLGAVGLVNSIRLTGHEQPIYLLDCGLAPGHRELLEPHVTVVDPPRPAAPYMLKTVAPRAHPADVQVLLDADMIVVRSLRPLVERAASGDVVAVRDRLDRFVPEWGPHLGLGEIEPRPYVSSGFLCLGGTRRAELLDLWHELLRRVDYERSFFERDEAGYPFRFIDQDVLNALIAARVPPATTVVLERELVPSPPFEGVKVLDERTLRCAGSGGASPYVLHHYLRKPWLERMYHGAYSRLLARLLLGDDVAVKVPAEEVPLRMRTGARALMERKRADVTDLVRWYARDVIPEWLAARLDRSRRSAER